MAQWKKNDQANNSPIWVAAQLGKTVNTAIQTQAFNNVTAGVFGSKTAGVFGVDKTEMKVAHTSPVARPAHSGWNLRTVGSGGRAGRVQYETLVAMKSITGDSGDAVLKKAGIVIKSQPLDAKVVTNTATSLAVVAETIPSVQTINYEWQVAAGANGTFSAIAGAPYTDTNTATLGIANTTGLNGVRYRALLTTANGTNVYSRTAFIRVV